MTRRIGTAVALLLAYAAIGFAAVAAYLQLRP